MAELIHGDALESVAALPERSIDAVITDPPYCAGAVGEAQRSRAPGQGIRSENLRRFGWFTGDNMGTAGLVFLMRSLAFICAQHAVKPSGSLLTFCDWRMASSLQPAIESAGLRFQGLIVWDKGSMGLGTGFRCQHELILHFTFGAPEYHDKSIGNVIRCPRVDSEVREHQAQKPVDLKLVRVVAPVDGTVLDPFMGSGSVGVACEQEGRQFVGIDRDVEHVAAARARIAREESAAAWFGR